MVEAGAIGLDLAKNVFQADGAAVDGSVGFRRKLTRPQVQRVFAEKARGTGPWCMTEVSARDPFLFPVGQLWRRLASRLRSGGWRP